MKQPHRVVLVERLNESRANSNDPRARRTRKYISVETLLLIHWRRKLCLAVSLVCCSVWRLLQNPRDRRRGFDLRRFAAAVCERPACAKRKPDKRQSDGSNRKHDYSGSGRFVYVSRCGIYDYGSHRRCASNDCIRNKRQFDPVGFGIHEGNGKRYPKRSESGHIGVCLDIKHRYADRRLVNVYE